MTHFMELPCLSEKNRDKKPEGAACIFPRTEVHGGTSSPHALCSFLLGPHDSGRQGGLCSSRQDLTLAARCPVT